MRAPRLGARGNRDGQDTAVALHSSFFITFGHQRESSAGIGHLWIAKTELALPLPEEKRNIIEYSPFIPKKSEIFFLTIRRGRTSKASVNHFFFPKLPAATTFNLD